MTAFASGNSCFRNSHEQKLQNSALPNSGRVCRFSPWNSARCFRIQRKLNSGLWLGAFGKAGLFRCQSTFATRFCQRNRVSLCKGTKAAKSYAFCDSLPVSAFASGNSYFINSLVQKRKNSAKQNSWIVCLFSPLKPAFFSRIQLR